MACSLTEKLRAACKKHHLELVTDAPLTVPTAADAPDTTSAASNVELFEQTHGNFGVDEDLDQPEETDSTTGVSFAKLLNLTEGLETDGKDEVSKAAMEVKVAQQKKKKDSKPVAASSSKSKGKKKATRAEPDTATAAPVSDVHPAPKKRASDMTAGGVKRLKLTDDEHYRLLRAKDAGVHRYGNPDRTNPSWKHSCDVCEVRRHTVVWEYRASTTARVTKGGSCYCCVRACAILGITRSVPTLRAAELIGKVVEQSNLVREVLQAEGRDDCASNIDCVV